MNLAKRGIGARHAVRFAVIAAAVTMCAPAMAQNKKNSWEVFIYFGGFFGHDVPSASQSGVVGTYRTEPSFADIGPPSDPNNLDHVFTPNLGLVGGDQSGNPNYPFETDQGSIFQMAPCLANNHPLSGPSDPRAPYFDECDNDQESVYLYNAQGIVTNGEIQRDDTEFSLGIRGGYNITRHWEVELDLGFGKQRLDLTENLIPLLTASVNSLSDPRAAELASFFQFTWANTDYGSIVPSGAPQEHPSVVASRIANDPAYTIPMYYPVPVGSGGSPPPGEVFEDVTGFVNRVFQDPTAWRNRGNQINIDYFSVSASAVYNFNTKADSRIVPYLSAGVGTWIRNFDSPYEGENTSYYLGGTGIRFFVNEIFSFRADARYIKYMDDSFEITGELTNFNIPDREAFGGCLRDQRNPAPPCAGVAGQVPPEHYAFPDLGGGGGNASIGVVAELDDFYEIRIGFDVILGGK